MKFRELMNQRLDPASHALIKDIWQLSENTNRLNDLLKRFSLHRNVFISNLSLLDSSILRQTLAFLRHSVSNHFSCNPAVLPLESIEHLL